jgi:hypothetical protein
MAATPLHGKCFFLFLCFVSTSHFIYKEIGIATLLLCSRLCQRHLPIIWPLCRKQFSSSSAVSVPLTSSISKLVLLPCCSAPVCLSATYTVPKIINENCDLSEASAVSFTLWLHLSVENVFFFPCLVSTSHFFCKENGFVTLLLCLSLHHLCSSKNNQQACELTKVFIGYVKLHLSALK